MQAKPIDIWISSFQDQLYYENMVKLYKEKVDKKFEAKVVQQTRRMGAELLEYNSDTGTWRFVIDM